MNDPKDFIQGTGAKMSYYDARTIQHDMASVPLVQGGYIYTSDEILMQYKIGKCTAISLVQNANKALGKKFSDDFQYLLQKKYFDLNWDEGSSIFNALKVGKTYGFLPAELWTHTNVDTMTTYEEYVSQLQSIQESEIQRLIGLCTNKLTGYAQVDTSNPQSIAKAISDSKSGILCRYLAGSTWYTAVDGRLSWSPIDIDPLRPPTEGLSGHAIGATYFDYTLSPIVTLANTWSTAWNCQGNAHDNLSNYKMDEAWIPYYDFTPVVPPFTHNFMVEIKIGDRGDEVSALQKALSTLGYFKIPPTGYYGPITMTAVFNFQKDKVALSWYERYFLRGRIVGQKTRDALNLIFNK